MAPDTRPYASVPDYIYGCTREIWEDRGVGEKLIRYYAPDCLVRAPGGLTTSMAGVAADTLATLHQFPDRQLVGEDVVWKATGGGDFLSSHRLISVMRHTGDGRWGTARGNLFKTRVIADCWVTGGVITEEWLIRDGGGFAQCLGQTPRELATELMTRGDQLQRSGRLTTVLRAIGRRYLTTLRSGWSQPPGLRSGRGRPCPQSGKIIMPVAPYLCQATRFATAPANLSGSQSGSLPRYPTQG